MQAVRTRSTPLALGRQFVWPNGQALLCVSVFLLACSAAIVVWRTFAPSMDYPLGVALLAVSLPVAANVSLRVGQGVRLYFTGASILFIVALMPPPLAVVVIGLGMLAKELSVCRRCGNMTWQVLGQVGRWMVVALCASAIVHSTNVLAASAIIGGFLWAGDVLTAPLVLRTESSLPELYRNLVERTWVDELMQYMTGALLLPVVVLQHQDPLFVAASIAVVGLWLLMVYVMHAPSDRRLP